MPGRLFKSERNGVWKLSAVKPCSRTNALFNMEQRAWSLSRKEKNGTVDRCFQVFRGQVLLVGVRRDDLSFGDDLPPHRTACRCRPLPDGQRSGQPAVAGGVGARPRRTRPFGSRDPTIKFGEGGQAWVWELGGDLAPWSIMGAGEWRLGSIRMSRT
jgi:hypothetical protein